MNTLEKKKILEVGVTDASSAEVLEYVFESLKNSREKYYIVTPNPEIVVYAHRENSFRALLNESEIAICDGIGLFLASKVLGSTLKARVTGTDLMDAICKNSVKVGKDEVRKPVSIGFLGAGEGVALKTSKCLGQKYPGLSVSFAGAELPKGEFPPTDILFVAYGFPKQEEFMRNNLERLPVTVMMGVGGAFDFISGTIPRAPRMMQSLGLEWLYRLIRQPWRLKRQLSLITFLILVLQERFKK